MRLRSRVLLSFVPVALAALLVAPAPAANAAVTCSKYTVGGVVVPRPFLETGYGPVSHGTQRGGSNAAPTARPGFYSPVTGGFSATAGYTSVYDENAQVTTNVPSSDGVSGLFCGYRALNSPYGPVVYGIQYSGTQGRWGNVNLLTGTFYSDGSGWSPLAG